MIHDKIFKREDGTQFKLSVRFFIDSYKNNGLEYMVDCWTRAKGKKKWQNLPDERSQYEYRKLPMDERSKLINSNILRFVTPEEVQETKLELWEKLKP